VQLLINCPITNYNIDSAHAHHHSINSSFTSIYPTGLNFFMGGVVGSTALARVPELVNRPFETPQLLGYALPASSKFFFTYLILRTFMSLPLRFLIPQPGVWQAWIRMGFSPFFKSLRSTGASARTQFMRHAIRSPRYGCGLWLHYCSGVLLGCWVQKAVAGIVDQLGFSDAPTSCLPPCPHHPPSPPAPQH